MLIRFIFSSIVCLVFVFSCSNKESKTVASSSTKTQEVVDGALVFKKNCVICHGEDGKLGLNGSKDLTISDLDLSERIAMITKGKGLMTPFENILSLSEIKAVAEYTMQLQDLQ